MKAAFKGVWLQNHMPFFCFFSFSYIYTKKDKKYIFLVSCDWWNDTVLFHQSF